MRAELDYCVPLGIPHSTFLGWSAADRGYALAWTINKNATCSCGTRKDEWDEDSFAYMPDTHFCRGHQVLAEHQKTLPKTDDGHALPGFFSYLRPATDDDFD